jgi:hypothetical protein
MKLLLVSIIGGLIALLIDGMTFILNDVVLSYCIGCIVGSVVYALSTEGLQWTRQFFE